MHKERVVVNLALQGGGSHGAFTWGVLDRLLEEEWLEIEGVCGTSAGAMNAAVLADGYAAGGRDGARKALDSYWRHVWEAAQFSPFQRTPLERMMGHWSLEQSPGYLFVDFMTRMFSPYQYNPTGQNALAPILDRQINFERLRTSPIKLFITATNVRTGRPRIFRNAEITPNVLMASACLPALFQAVEIDGDPYWDGGYSGNPTLTPLVTELDSDDTILVPVNPLQRQGTPRTPTEILNRLNEVSFNAVLVKELYMIDLLQRAAGGAGDNHEAADWARMRIHVVSNPVMNALDFSSKLNAEQAFIDWLKAEGRKAAEGFLQQHGTHLGQASSVKFEDLLAQL
ncbi:patatin-like phospholipase family protein [Xanthobacter sp. TB0139]|uniref:patatin-like phospholipase family protein n=1 Tax=Xanthobacter sp. TB0139 TaxID=3459178 RepID=UPI00403A134F